MRLEDGWEIKCGKCGYTVTQADVDGAFVLGKHLECPVCKEAWTLEFEMPEGVSFERDILGPVLKRMAN
jgi:hypothetical protein